MGLCLCSFSIQACILHLILFTGLLQRNNPVSALLIAFITLDYTLVHVLIRFLSYCIHTAQFLHYCSIHASCFSSPLESPKNTHVVLLNACIMLLQSPESPKITFFGFQSSSLESPKNTHCSFPQSAQF
ncbi:hypothetical protein XENOCAPTIV_021424 [Xenoophorus captivus]|uniref:Uncharacterized protein n=1 Tax=Xenoophorus captivus TaxID=1517983 RepID=A0ABV0R1H5_9TELE